MKNLWWVVLAALVYVAISAFGFYNSRISAGPVLDNSYAQMQSMYERRADLIPQLAAVVKKYAQYESGTLVAVINARNEATKNLEILAQMVKDGDAQSPDFSRILGGTMASVKAIAESYPQLKADIQFTALFTELEGTENRIRTSIKDYNDAATAYNTSLVRMPDRFYAQLFWFSAKQLVTPPADKPIKEVPNVDKLLE